MLAAFLRKKRAILAAIMTRRVVPAVLFCFTAALARAKPNLNGAWSFNFVATDYGPLPNKPDKIAMTIEQADPAIQMIQAITGAQGTFAATFKYSTDKEIANINPEAGQA